MTRYRFDPGEMRALAADLRRASTAAGAAGLALLTVSTDGLPPEAKGLVQSQARAVWRLLSTGDSALSGGARYLTRMAAAVTKADDPTLRAAGLDIVTTTKSGKIILRELGDGAARRNGPLGDRARRWASLLGTLSGRKAIDQAVGWSEWRDELRVARVNPNAAAARRISVALRQRARDNIDELRRLQPHRVKVPFDAGDGKWKRWARRFVGLAPGPAGDVADLAGYVAASRKLRADEPQTGVSQALTDVRDFVDLVGASNHLAADVYLKSPFTAPAAVVNETVALAADGVTLTFDGVNEARKGLGKAAESVTDAFGSLARPRWP